MLLDSLLLHLLMLSQIERNLFLSLVVPSCLLVIVLILSVPLCWGLCLIPSPASLERNVGKRGIHVVIHFNTLTLNYNRELLNRRDSIIN
jgi:hypothetical protein